MNRSSSHTKGFVAALLLSVSLFSACTPPRKPPAEPGVSYEPVGWSQVEGWAADQVEEAWSAFLATCHARGSRVEWEEVCAAARDQRIADSAGARSFFETHFAPYRVLAARQDASRPDMGLITGYYEPLLHGARRPSNVFSVPLYGLPDDLLSIDLESLYPELKGMRLRGRLQGRKVVPYFSRAELQDASKLSGKELVWVDNEVDAFFLQIQGSGRVRLEDGQTIRLAYADQNGHPYRSIGRYLVERGELSLEQATAQGIRRWIELNPARTREVLDSNPSVVFFREEEVADPTQGPKGALGVPLTAGRSIAVDPRFIPLGAPVFLSTTYPESEIPLRRLVMAQDTGGAIRGAVRADLFWGFGSEAGEQAGRMRQQGSLTLLWPKTMSPPRAAP